MARPPITASLIAALQQPIEATLNGLISEFGWEARGILESVGELRQRLDAWNIEALPPLSHGDLETVRVLKNRVVVDAKILLDQELANDENGSIEFKETLYLDVKKFTKSGLPISQCGSEPVLLSAFKSIAAFMNSDGGTLIIGATDEKEKVGVAPEFELTCPTDSRNFDHWELFLRAKISHHFVGGRSMLPLIQVQRVEYEGGVLLARIVVGPRKGLTFVRSEGKEYLFIRAGNETLNVPFSQIGDFFELRRI